MMRRPAPLPPPRALAKLTWIELKLFAREPFALVFTFAFPLVVLATLVGSFEPDDPAFGGARPSDYYLASYVGVVIAAVGLVALPVHLAAYRERGVLRRLRASRVPAAAVLAAQAVVGLVMTLLGGAVLVVAGRAVYGAALPSSPAGVALAVVGGTLGFLALGFLVAGLAGSARAAQAIGMILFFPMWLLSGAGPPPEVMGEGMRRVSDLLPLTHVVRALQDPWLGTAADPADLLLVAAMLLLGTVLAARTLRSA
jgi:ABC-2 type transport system permease protein